MYCIKLSICYYPLRDLNWNKIYCIVLYCIVLYCILPYQLFMFNDFNDLETFRASDKRIFSDFNQYLKCLNIF